MHKKKNAPNYDNVRVEYKRDLMAKYRKPLNALNNSNAPTAQVKINNDLQETNKTQQKSDSLG